MLQDYRNDIFYQIEPIVPCIIILRTTRRTHKTRNVWKRSPRIVESGVISRENWQMVILSIESSTDSSFYVFRALVTTTPLTILSTTIRKSHDKWTYVSTGSTERLPIFVPPHPFYTHMYIHGIHLKPFHRSLSRSIYTYVRVVCVYILYVYAIHVTGRRPCPSRRSSIIK